MAKTGYLLRHIIDRCEAGACMSGSLAPVRRVIYCHRGSVALSDGGHLEADEAWFGTGAIAVEAGAAGAVLWRYELDADDAEPHLLTDPGFKSELTVSEALDGPDPSDDWILRCDSVKFPMGGMAFRHVHQGPGIRVLREGQIQIETKGETHTFLPGQAWFEAGPDPVVATASELECTKFVRVMVLPEELKGKSSIQYINPEDFDKPKTQRYKGYVDEPIDH